MAKTTGSRGYLEWFTFYHQRAPEFIEKSL